MCLVMKTLTTKREIKLKSGEIIPAGESGRVEFDTVSRSLFSFHSPSLGRPVKLGFSAFTRVFGLKAPGMKTLERWVDEGVAKTVFGARTEPDGTGPDGEPSWLLVLGII